MKKSNIGLIFLNMIRHISQSELKSYLWGAATFLRGYIDAGDYKQFIFPLLFYKRLCDVYDEGPKSFLSNTKSWTRTFLIKPMDI